VSDETSAASHRAATVQQVYFRDKYAHLEDASIALDPLPGFLRLGNPRDGADVVGMFTGRQWLVDRIDAEISECVRRNVGGYLLVEADAGMGKTALAVWLAFDGSRRWPTHATRLASVPADRVRRNLAAQIIARWDLAYAAPGGTLPAEAGSPAFLHNLLVKAAQQRDRVAPGTAVVLVVDGLDEAPPAEPGELPFGLPPVLPAGTVIVALTRPGKRLSQRLQARVVRIDVESDLNRDDLAAFLRRAAADDPDIVGALAAAGVAPDRFCRTLMERSEGVWVYAAYVLDQIRDRQRSPAKIDRLPTGLARYYADSIDRWRSTLPDGWEPVGLPLLATLAAARQPLPAGILASWAGVPLPVGRRLLDPWRPDRQPGSATSDDRGRLDV